MNGTNLRRRFNAGLLGLAVIVGGLALLLATPLDSARVPAVLVNLQTGARAAVQELAPFVLVGSIGAIVGLAELSSTFGEYPREAIASRWGQYLVWLNAITATLAYLVARIYAPSAVDPLMLILGVGLGFPMLIRTKFTLARQFGGPGGQDVSIDLGWLYEQFQKLCKKQIDLDLMSYRRAQVDRLLGRYSTVQELYQTAVYTLNARATLTPEEEQVKLEELKQAVDPTLPAELARLNLGLLILELGGLAYVDLLTRAKRAAESAPAARAEVAPETAVKKLAELPLADLTQRALKALTVPEDHQRVSALAEPAPGLPELTQRASIARYVVDHLGPEAALQLAAPG